VCLVVRGNKIVSDQRKLSEFGWKPPHVDNIHCWFKQFKETWRVCKRKSSGRPAVIEENVERIFFFWGYIKNVYAEKMRDLQFFKDRFCAAIEIATPEMLSCVWEEAEYRLDICMVTGGTYIKIYYISYSLCAVLVFF
jgi:hypothetical protein